MLRWTCALALRMGRIGPTVSLDIFQGLDQPVARLFILYFVIARVWLILLTLFSCFPKWPQGNLSRVGDVFLR
jgi:hypothetical protein